MISKEGEGMDHSFGDFCVEMGCGKPASGYMEMKKPKAWYHVLLRRAPKPYALPFCEEHLSRVGNWGYRTEAAEATPA